MKWSKAVLYAKETSGLSHRELADRIGVDFTYISHLIKGKRTPSIDVVEKIAKATGLTPFELFTVAYADEIISMGQQKIQEKFKLAISFKSSE